jgi:2-polyprenyl-3-methyl-5-hydroxy-6-metoxy-1,4-benzoquinol methylase
MMRESDWNGFWSRSRGGRFTRESWSKRRILAVLDPYLRRGARVLDAGCGSGSFSACFLGRGLRVTAMDISDEALDLARAATKNGADAYWAEDLLDPDFARRHGEAFDLVFSDGLLEHFEESEQKRIVRNMAGVLVPGGVVATFVPNKWSLWEWVRPLFMPGIHETPFTAGALRSVHAGLSVADVGGVNVLPFRLSPDKLLAARFGMLLYLIGQKG